MGDGIGIGGPSIGAGDGRGVGNSRAFDCDRVDGLSAQAPSTRTSAMKAGTRANLTRDLPPLTARSSAWPQPTTARPSPPAALFKATFIETRERTSISHPLWPLSTGTVKGVVGGPHLELVPLLRTLSGFRAFYFVQEAKDRGAVVILWDRAEDAQQAAGVIGPGWFHENIAPHLASDQVRVTGDVIVVGTP